MPLMALIGCISPCNVIHDATAVTPNCVFTCQPRSNHTSHEKTAKGTAFFRAARTNPLLTPQYTLSTAGSRKQTCRHFVTSLAVAADHQPQAGAPCRCSGLRSQDSLADHVPHPSRAPVRMLQQQHQLQVTQQQINPPTGPLGACSLLTSKHAASAAGRANEDEIAAAWTLLKAFSASQFKGLSQQYVATPDARAKLRAALLVSCAYP